MTKEEIINKYWENPTDLLGDIPKMLDEWARIRSIEFYMYAVTRAFNLNEKETLSPDEIYNLFINQTK